MYSGLSISGFHSCFGYRRFKGVYVHELSVKHNGPKMRKHVLQHYCTISYIFMSFRLFQKKLCLPPSWTISHLAKVNVLNCRSFLSFFLFIHSFYWFSSTFNRIYVTPLSLFIKLPFHKALWKTNKLININIKQAFK